MGKVLCVLRVSTDRQDLSEQKNEMIQFCKQEGYSADEIITLEGIGASAIKLNQQYKNMVNTIKDYVVNNKVNCVAVWHVNRLGRNDEVLIELKNLFAKNKVQFISKNPYIKLLNEDGSLNSGSELAFSLFATMCKQDMEEKFQKWARTKKAYREQGKYSGGPNIKFGYKVDSNGFIVEDEWDGAVVKKIYELYATGKYANKSLFTEIKSLGLVKKDGTNICYVAVSKILRDTAYIGWTEDENGYKRNYPPIISKELWDKVESVRKGNYKNQRKGKRWTFATKLIKCPVCGGNMSADMNYYKCWQHNQFAHTATCSNDISVKISILDGLLWNIASSMHMDYLINLDDDTINQLKEKANNIQIKIDVLQKDMEGIAAKKKKIVDTYLEDLISKEERDKRLNKVDIDNKTNIDTLNTYKEEIDRLNALIQTSIEDKENVDRMVDIMLDVTDETDAEKMYNIIHQHISKVVVTRMILGEGKEKKLALRILITTTNNGDIEFAYAPRKYRKHYVYKKLNNEYKPYQFEEITRDSNIKVVYARNTIE